jgi:hypothetical protein
MAVTTYQEPSLIILGVILLIIGFVAKIAILWTIGIVVVVIGAILALLGMAGHAAGGRRPPLLTWPGRRTLKTLLRTPAAARTNKARQRGPEFSRSGRYPRRQL